MRKVPKRITVRMLERLNACPEGVAMFREQFGESAAFVPGNIYAAWGHVGELSLWWLLTAISPESNAGVVLRCNAASPWRCVCDAICAAELCRLARQNLPARKAAKAGQAEKGATA
jgi:hypothetical protein